MENNNVLSMQWHPTLLPLHVIRRELWRFSAKLQSIGLRRAIWVYLHHILWQCRVCCVVGCTTNEVQSTEMREMESIGARHIALSSCPVGLLCVDRQFQVPHLWNAFILVHCRECGGCLSCVSWWEEGSNRRAETVLSGRVCWTHWVWTVERFVQCQPAIQAVTVSIRLEDQRCAMRLGVPGCGHAPRQRQLNQ